MLRALLWMTSNFTRCAILTDLWWRIIMERNGSFVSGYLCEILPSAKEPRGDSHVTQNSSEARPNNAFSRKGTGTGLGECPLNCSRKQMINFTYAVNRSNSRQMIRDVSRSVVTRLSCRWPDSTYFRLWKLRVTSTTYSLFSLSFSSQM